MGGGSKNDSGDRRAKYFCECRVGFFIGYSKYARYIRVEPADKLAIAMTECVCNLLINYVPCKERGHQLVSFKGVNLGSHFF